MATKKMMYEDITGFIEDYEIKSVNGRHFKRDNVYNLVFNCKYHNLPERVQDTFFIEGSISEYDYELFREMLIEHIEDKFKHNYIDWDNTGFYGRSSGNYCVSFHAGTIADMVYYGFDWCDENYLYIDFKEAHRDIQRSIKIMEYIKQYMIDYFTGVLEAYKVEWD
jgi:hypothetical protein